MRIIELCLSPNFGGLEIYLCRLVEELAKKNNVVTVASSGSPIYARLQAGGHQLRVLHSSLRHLPLLAAFRLASIIDELEIDLVHVNWAPDLTLAALAKCFSRRKPKLVHTRHMMINRSKHDLYHSFVYGQYDRILAVSAEMEQGLQRHLPKRQKEYVDLVYCGVPAPESWLEPEERKSWRRELKLPKEAFVAGVFSRLEEAKGQHLLIDAIATLHQKGVIIHGLIVGRSMDDDYAASLRKQAARLGVESLIVFRDFVEQPQLLMQACDCVVLPTNRETFGLVLVEAMRCEVPVIGSNAGGVPEIIEHAASGLLFEPGDAKSLTAQLRRLYADPLQREKLAAAGRSRADALFNSEKQLSKVATVFTELLSGHDHGRQPD